MIGQLLLVATGGALGAMSRFLAMSGVTSLMGKDFPYGTLLINASGSLIAGIMLVLVMEKEALSVHSQALILIGFLGAFTTFSAFSLETLQLFESGMLLNALLNVLLNVSTSLIAAWTGVYITRQL